MTYLMLGANSVMWLLAMVLATMVGYLVFLAVAALRASAHTTIAADDRLRQFIFLIPAHNEERLLPNLLASLGALDYPATHYSVHVVADNCTDGTAELATAMQAVAHERFDTSQIGKGYALQWLLERLWQANVPFDAAIILDADSVVTPNFLRVMNAKMSRGARVVQAYYAVLMPQRAWAVGLRAVALAAIHYLRPQGRMVIGASAGLKGNGMLFARSVLVQHQWSASVTEDIEYHMALILAGERVSFAPDAVVCAEMPSDLRAARTQNIRWEQGRIELAKRYVPQLIRAAWAGFRGNRVVSPLVTLDAVMEHIIPPFSVLVGLTLIVLVMAVTLASGRGLVIFALLLFGELGYLMMGLKLTHATRETYMSLLFAPIFLCWKIWLYLRVLFSNDRQHWVRTARVGEPSPPIQGSKS